LKSKQLILELEELKTKSLNTSIGCQR